MIEFKCTECGHKIGAPDKYAGKLVRCPGCKTPINVPQAVTQPAARRANVIKFHCPHCNHAMRAASDHAGRRVRCAKCKNPFSIPDLPAQPSPPATSDPTAVLRAGHEPHPKPPTTGTAAESNDDLLLAGLDQPSMKLQPPVEAEAPLKLHPPALDLPGPPPRSDYDLPDDDSFEYAGGGALHSSRGNLAQPGHAEKKRSGILVGAVCGLAMLLMAILAWHYIGGFVNIIGLTGKNVQEAQRFTEEYISLLEAGEIDMANELLSPELQSYVPEGRLDSFASMIGKSEMVDLRCTSTYIEKQDGGYECLLLYSLHYDSDVQMVVASVVKTDGDLRIDGIAMAGSSGQSLSLGPRSFEKITQTMRAAPVETFPLMAPGFRSGFAIVWLGLAVIYIISMWIVFSKAGQPGWASIIPIYNAWILAEVGGKPGWWGLIVCFIGIVPFFGVIIALVLMIMISIGVAEAFGRGTAFGLGLCFLGLIFYPILAFSTD